VTCVQARQVGRAARGASLSTPSFGTPAASAQSTPARACFGGGAEEEALRCALETAACAGAPGGLRLDAFLQRYTSEDNAAFEQALARVNARRAAGAHPSWCAARVAGAHGHAGHLRAADAHPHARAALLRDAAPQDGFGSSGQPLSGVLWRPEAAQNSLFFVPHGGYALTVAEQGPASLGPQRCIDARATRFQSAEAAAAAAEGDAEAGAEERRQGAYSRVATPSVTPGASPFMTWGRLDATPLRLDPLGGEFAEGLPGGGIIPPSSSGFHMAQPARRDVVAASLGAGHAAGGAPRQGEPPRRGGATPFRGKQGHLSDTALKVLRAQRGDSGADAALRASYGGRTPLGTPAVSTRSTPRSTPRREAGEAPAAKKARADNVLTDA